MHDKIGKSLLRNCGVPSKKCSKLFIFPAESSGELERQMILFDSPKDKVYGKGTNPSMALGTEDAPSAKNGFIRMRQLSYKKIIQVAASTTHVLALTAKGEIITWGKNICVPSGWDEEPSQGPKYLELSEDGDDDGTRAKVIAIAAGFNVSFALDERGRLFSWGRNTSGILCNGNINEDYHKPRMVSWTSDEKPIQVYCTCLTGFFQTTSNKLYGWGLNVRGEIGCGSEEEEIATQPTLVALDYDQVQIKQFVTGHRISAILSQEGQVYVWGKFETSIDTPTRITLNHPVNSLIACGTRIAAYSDGGKASVFRVDKNHLQPTEIAFKQLICSLLYDTNTKLLIHIEKERYSGYGEASDIFNDSSTSDVQFLFEEKIQSRSSVKILHAHKSILSNRSEVFANRFSDRWLCGEGIIKIPVDYCSYDVFHSFLYFLYSGRLKMESFSMPQLVELYDAGERHLILPLTKLIIEEIQLRLKNVPFESLTSAYDLAASHDQLRSTIIRQMSKNLTKENCIRVAKYGHNHGHESLLMSASKFMLKNKITLTEDLDINEEGAFVEHFIKSLLMSNKDSDSEAADVGQDDAWILDSSDSEDDQ